MIEGKEGVDTFVFALMLFHRFLHGLRLHIVIPSTMLLIIVWSLRVNSILALLRPHRRFLK